MRNIVFSDKNKLLKLNLILHPIVNTQFTKWYRKQTSDYIIKESALLFETNNYKLLDKTILVYASKKVRFERVFKRDISASLIDKVMSNQLIFKEVKEKADFIINNNGEELLIPQVIKIHELLFNL